MVNQLTKSLCFFSFYTVPLSDLWSSAVSPALPAADGRSSAAVWPAESAPPPPSAHTAASADDTWREETRRCEAQKLYFHRDFYKFKCATCLYPLIRQWFTSIVLGGISYLHTSLQFLSDRSAGVRHPEAGTLCWLTHPGCPSVPAGWPELMPTENEHLEENTTGKRKFTATEDCDGILVCEKVHSCSNKVLQKLIMY